MTKRDIEPKLEVEDVSDADLDEAVGGSVEDDVKAAYNDVGDAMEGAGLPGPPRWG